MKTRQTRLVEHYQHDDYHLGSISTLMTVLEGLEICRDQDAPAKAMEGGLPCLPCPVPIQVDVASVKLRLRSSWVPHTKCACARRR